MSEALIDRTIEKWEEARKKCGQAPSKMEIEMERTNLKEAEAGEMHPWYGPCDGLGSEEGVCSECERMVEIYSKNGSTTKIYQEAPNRASTLPTDSQARKHFPVATGVLDYFPDAMVAIAEVSYAGNEQHNPGEPLHWARGKSMDQDDTLIRHFLERGKLDKDGLRHSAKMAWRALAILQLEIEEASQHEGES